MSYFLYILRSELKETYYIGISNDPERRLYSHNNSDTKKYTKRYRPWELVYIHQFESKQEAVAAEKKVKSWKSKKMVQLLLEDEIQIEKYL